MTIRPVIIVRMRFTSAHRIVLFEKRRRRRRETEVDRRRNRSDRTDQRRVRQDNDGM